SLIEARREMEICNACRYCEGFCAVFPAMARERAFSGGDLTYLANLCHNCQGCYYACQYAPPHPFGVNVPRTFAVLRHESYQDYAWPRPLAHAFDRNGLVVAVATAVALALVLILVGAGTAPGVLGHAYHGPGAFYRIVPWAAMAGVAAVTLLFSLAALAVAGSRFWRDAGQDTRPPLRAVAAGLRDALTLKNLGGGGHGCNDRDEAFSQGRRHCHHAMAYGFLACFASTLSAAFEAYALGLPAPYPVFSLPVVLGAFGGAGLVIGTSGLIWLKIAANRAAAAENLFGADFALLVLLWLAAASGLLLLGFRQTSAMGTLLAIHLGLVLSLFVLLPYSKFVHAVHRSLALVRNAADGPA
ncbi:MAG TPA: tricarballylate utilization 4Fe-4S protein TcuB, partial [Acidisoma sp.]|uniref:tricarballylate utilization 4Fe-4S protein TcuB n=1 Tax=Acidisoma sp. TaxID=1872115 RepID=UPI002C68441E